MSLYFAVLQLFDNLSRKPSTDSRRMGAQKDSRQIADGWQSVGKGMAEG